jgi:uncharacterized protein
VIAPTNFEWDEAKAVANAANHNVPFRYAVRVFDDKSFVITDVSRAEDNEVRLKAIGMVEGRLLTVVFTMRGEVCRIISARRPNRPEERLYDNRSL